MRNPFRTDFTITQAFGVNPDYYKQFGLKAHEGLDVVPTGSDLSVLALEDGVCVKDEDNPRSGAYGVYVTLWHPSIKKATQYCHLQSNTVSLNQQVKKGDVIGTMGSTGNSTGPHLHINLFDVDDNGVRLNRDNGYLGGTDPLPFLNVVDDQQKVINELREARDKNWQLYLAEVEIVKEKDARIAELEGQVSTLKKQYEDEQKHTVELNSQLEQAHTQMAQVKAESKDYGQQIIDLSHERDEYRMTVEMVAEYLHSTTDKKTLYEALQTATTPHEETVGEYQKLYDWVFSDFVKRRVTEAKPILKRLIERIRSWWNY